VLQRSSMGTSRGALVSAIGSPVVNRSRGMVEGSWLSR
jgi:hypothetical protein